MVLCEKSKSTILLKGIRDSWKEFHSTSKKYERRREVKTKNIACECREEESLYMFIHDEYS